MSKVMVDISELRREAGEKVEDLAKLIKDRVSAKVDVATEEITISYEDIEKSPPKTYVRVLIRKFLHRSGLKGYFRVISGKKNTYVLKKLPEPEEE
jgi:hypothetical protein